MTADNLKGYEFFAELYRGLRAYFTYYNDERLLNPRLSKIKPAFFVRIC
jgi:hypothetical protein